MGTGPSARKKGIANKKKQYKKASSTKRRAKDVDQIQVRRAPDSRIPGAGALHPDPTPLACARHACHEIDPSA